MGPKQSVKPTYGNPLEILLLTNLPENGKNCHFQISICFVGRKACTLEKSLHVCVCVRVRACVRACMCIVGRTAGAFGSASAETGVSR